MVHLIRQLYPEAIPKSGIPWPFKMRVYGKPVKPNENRDDKEGPGIDDYFSTRSEIDLDSGGGDAGGGSD